MDVFKTLLNSQGLGPQYSRAESCDSGQSFKNGAEENDGEKEANGESN